LTAGRTRSAFYTLRCHLAEPGSDPRPEVTGPGWHLVVLQGFLQLDHVVLSHTLDPAHVVQKGNEVLRRKDWLNRLSYLRFDTDNILAALNDKSCLLSDAYKARQVERGFS
jgi:hypothetical protein